MVASIEAEARTDEAEVKRLIQTCPKIHCTQNEYAYADTMATLFQLDLLMQRNLLEIIVYYYCIRNKDVETAIKWAKKAATYEEAWRQVIEDLGISYEAFRNAKNLRTNR